jgi:hypothetical protein
MTDTSQAITTTQPNAAALQTAGVFGTFDALEKFGNYIYQSNMFGARNPAEGFVIGITCQQEGMTLLQFKERYHVMMGQVTIKSEAMLANLLELGGEYEIQARTPDRVAIKLTYKKASFLSEIKWEDIKDEAYTRANKDASGRNYADNVPIEQRRYKDNWSTPRRRMQMMWARAVSDGVRTVCPLATRGHYTPEEAIDFDEPKTINITPAPVAFPQQEAEQPAQAVITHAATAPAPAPATPVAEVLPPQEPQTVTQPTASAPTPEMFKNIGPADLDYTICKIDGPMNGIKWSDMNMENLRLALEITNPQIYEQDKDHIRALIHQYNAAASGVKGDN